MTTLPKMKGRLLRTAAQRAVTLLLLAACHPAYAQIAKMTRNADFVYATIAGLCVAVFSVLVVIAGIEIGARHRKLLDIWHIVVGAAVSGSGAVIAATMIN